MIWHVSPIFLDSPMATLLAAAPSRWRRSGDSILVTVLNDNDKPGPLQVLRCPGGMKELVEIATTCTQRASALSASTGGLRYRLTP